MALKGGTNKACAACKYQRRRCSKDCPLAPYFPSDKPKTFSNAHRLFGVCNIMRILKQVKPEEKDEAMKSIIFESDMRARYPDRGCYGVMLQYQVMVFKAMEELRYVQTLLALCKEQTQLPLNEWCQHLPFFPQEILPTGEFPIYNCPPSHIGSNDMKMKTVTNVVDAKPNNLMLNHREEVDIPARVNANAMIENFEKFGVVTNAIDAKYNLMSMQGFCYHEEMDVKWNAMDEKAEKFIGITNASVNDIDAKSNLTSMQGLSYHMNDMDEKSAKFSVIASAIDAKSNFLTEGLSYHEELDIAGFSGVNANATDPKSKTCDFMTVEGLSNFNELDVSDYDDTSFEESAEDRQSLLKFKACNSSMKSADQSVTNERLRKNESFHERKNRCERDTWINSLEVRTNLDHWIEL